MIYKVALLPGEVRRINGFPIHVGVQHRIWQVWYVVGGDVLYDVTVVGTGEGHRDVTGWEHINTFLELDGALVWHAFRNNKIESETARRG